MTTPRIPTRDVPLASWPLVARGDVGETWYNTRATRVAGNGGRVNARMYIDGVEVGEAHVTIHNTRPVTAEPAVNAARPRPPPRPPALGRHEIDLDDRIELRSALGASYRIRTKIGDRHARVGRMFFANGGWRRCYGREHGTKNFHVYGEGLFSYREVRDLCDWMGWDPSEIAQHFDRYFGENP